MSDRNTNVLFVGGVFPKEQEQEIIQNSRNNVQVAANNFQWNLIDGFDGYLTNPVSIFNEIYVGSFPKNYRKMIIPSYEFSHTTGAKDINLGFINVAYLKQIISPFNEKKKLRKWLKNHEKDKAVFIYSLNIRFVRIAKYIKKIDDSIPIIVSAMDLPEHIMKSRKETLIVRIWKKHLVKSVYEGLKYVDGCMLVADKQMDYIKKKPEDCITIEAIVPERTKGFCPLISGKKRIVYAGTIAKQYNILDLVEAFKRIEDNNVELVICGDGDTKDTIVNEAKEDQRIRYLGVLAKNELERIMEEAWILVNPRKSGQVFTAYSFPSKTMDYLLAGRPIICQKLEAIPKEYDDYLIYFDSVDSLEKKIRELLNYDIERINSIGRANYDFVTRMKSSKIQIKKIIGLFDKKRNELRGNRQ